MLISRVPGRLSKFEFDTMVVSMFAKGFTQPEGATNREINKF